MATSSITKNIVIKSRQTSRSLIAALEHAGKKSSKDVTLKKELRQLHGDEIKEIFKR